jgi:hypothetical protein
VESNQVIPFSLSFGRGLKFSHDIMAKFGHSVNFTPGFRKREFFLVVSFGRASFKLDVHTISIVLQDCFGGSPSQFHVSVLREIVFRFSVAYRSVHFEINNAGKKF